MMDDSSGALKRAKLDSTEEEGTVTNEKPTYKEIPEAKDILPKLSQAQTDALSILADTVIATSSNITPSKPPKFLPDLVLSDTDTITDGVDCHCAEEDEEMPPSEDID